MSQPSRPRPEGRGGMPWRTRAQKLQAIGLSAAAITMTYGAGYLLVTGPAGPEQAQLARQRLLTPPAQPGQYRDGTYRGAASNVFGSVEVAVTIGDGRIRQVQITRCTTFYPQSYVDGLPAKVLTAQSADVAVVSGATGSWQDFTAAVQQALAQAVPATSTSRGTRR
jgi:uncharacterized protein with FMN-binding domain